MNMTCNDPSALSDAGPCSSTPPQARMAALSAELAGVERDMLEAEAKHELLKLLEVRTR